MLAVAERESLGGSVSYGFPRRVVNIAQACAIAGVSRRTIYYWIANGKAQAIRTAGGRLRIYADSLWRKHAV